MDDDDDSEFNILGADEFLLDLVNEDPGSCVQVVSTGIRHEIVDDSAIEITKELSNALNSYIASESVVAEAVAAPVDVTVFDQETFTWADYEAICNGFEYAFPAADENENIPNDGSRAYSKISDYPLDPACMTFEFCHEYVMIAAGRRRILEKELQEQLQREYQVLLHERQPEETVRTQGDIATVQESLLNAKLETYAKLGMFREIQAIADEYPGKLDYCQRDKCGVTLIARLCIWPCAVKFHAYCCIIQFLSSKCHKWTGVNMKSLATGTTPLMIAARVGEPCIVEALLKCGANVNDTDSEGKTAATQAAERGRTDIVAMILAYQANPASAKLKSQENSVPPASPLPAQNGYNDLDEVITNGHKE